MISFSKDGSVWRLKLSVIIVTRFGSVPDMTIMNGADTCSKNLFFPFFK